MNMPLKGLLFYRYQIAYTGLQKRNRRSRRLKKRTTKGIRYKYCLLLLAVKANAEDPNAKSTKQTF